MRIFEAIIIVLILSGALASVAYYFVKSGKSDLPCGSCTCHKVKDSDDLKQHTKQSNCPEKKTESQQEK